MQSELLVLGALDQAFLVVVACREHIVGTSCRAIEGHAIVLRE